MIKDHEAVRKRLEEFFDKFPSVSKTELCRAAGISTSALSQFIHDKYTGNNDKIATVVNGFMDRFENRAAGRKVSFVETSVSELFFDIASVCHNLGRIGMAVGPSGIGKTEAAKEYKNRNSDTILIEASVGYTEKFALKKIDELTGGDGRGGKPDLLDGIVEKLKGSNRLIIIDEAEHLQDRILEVIRRIHDFTGVGVLYVGLPKFAATVINLRRDFDYIKNRIYMPAKFERITVDDAERILNTIIPNINGLSQVFHERSRGCARKMVFLAEECLRLQQLNGADLTEDFVESVDRSMKIEGLAYV